MRQTSSWETKYSEVHLLRERMFNFGESTDFYAIFECTCDIEHIPTAKITVPPQRCRFSQEVHLS